MHYSRSTIIYNTICMGVYSANKQQADRFYKVIKKTTKYPLSIRNDLIRLEHDPSSIAEYWVRVPVKLVKGGLWIGLINRTNQSQKKPRSASVNYTSEIIDVFRCCSTTIYS